MTHTVSHLNQYDHILVMIQGMIVDQGPYHELMTRNKVLRDLVYSVVNTNNDQYHRQISDISEYHTTYLKI